MDIAPDIACKRAQQPLYQFIGGLRNSADVMIVAGYYVDQRSIADVIDEVKALLTGGRCVKIMLKGDDPTFDRNYASSASMQCLGGCGRCLNIEHIYWEARRVCRELDELRPGFFEDPFAAL